MLSRQVGMPEQMGEAVMFFPTSASNIIGHLLVDAGGHLGTLPLEAR